MPVITPDHTHSYGTEWKADSTVTIKWNEAENADSYVVYQYKNGETYKFLVRYTINGRLSPTTSSGKYTVRVYYKPIVKAAATENSVTFTWEAVPGAEKYAVYKYVDGKWTTMLKSDIVTVTTKKN